ncbi:MAG TPA: PQQ-binding-like beta-propeller repeat protein, partial [Armatimonadota bacterium]|nr:PQQ-binding-like beta-propeller repeat protein [Armatimonadota bacterium]
AGPAVAGKRVFIVDHQGDQDILRMLDLRTGEEKGRYSYPEPARENYGFARCTPLIVNDKIYTVSYSGTVLCLDLNTGKPAWTRNLVREFGGRIIDWGYSWSMIIDDNKLIVQPGGPNAAVAALDPATGATVWAGGGSDKNGYATPVVATLNGKKQYVIFTAERLMGVDPANGRMIWSFPWKTGCDVNAATPIVMGNTILITTNYGHGTALVEVNGAAARQVWKNGIMSRFTTPLYLDGYCYVTTEANKLTCFDPKTGETKWAQSGFGWGGLCAVDGVIIACDGNSGDVVMFDADPSAYRELGRVKPLGGQSWTAPIVADGTLIVRNKKAIVALALK